MILWILIQYLEMEHIEKPTPIVENTKTRSWRSSRKHYDDELLEEINKDREEHGKKALKETKDIELAYDEETGELIEEKGQNQ